MIVSSISLSSSISIDDFLKAIDAEPLNDIFDSERHIHGYTIIDSLKAITSLSSFDYLQIYGWSSERALIFSGVKYGRSPMIAIRAHPLKPSMVAYLSPEQVDPLAIRLATLENIPLVKITLPVSILVDRLSKFE